MDVNEKQAVPETWIAVSLIMGFSFMLLVEHLTGSDHDHSDTHMHPTSEDIFDLNRIGRNQEDGGAVRNGDVGTGFLTYNTGGSKKAIKLTLGLVIHSLADGFALGASVISSESSRSGSSRSELPLVIFFALLIHKGTTARNCFTNHSL
jgi:solute carrier family 39 (zinc transporter), member 9